ncbi:amidohydrolase family protein [Novosphingobium sp.]|uniref:amidohydrolase family protein n=1 Tax=Novosphingobium sp. TaxID=1874826 RepID=UPI0022CA06D5|nr:amidohydrolase family protein [Novosphingobium sp.]MCZ8019253.1 amidohydrolase family protein [Novosphingobium sp.]MCZ8035061.1 amidohydrolase family protein [Novosphingobium sp.]MCZ8052629.1 amidohydrolase family protein [Novosphingobium sp.]MCZ8058728.1 amidohydrolase family protein [Novosphingobium sp.]MCZ8233125.1 amidohydrolase family protein [Novosphingobium sp.]
MNLRLLAAAALATTFLAHPALAQTQEYRVLTQNRDIGHLKLDRQGQTIAVDYDFKQNGRGPTIKEQVTLDKDGAPVSWTITGRTTFGNAVNESFKRTATQVSWRDLSGPGSLKGKDLPKYYAAQNGSPLDVALLAKALLADADRTMPVAPGGTARLTERARNSFDGPDGKLEVITYELSGLSLNPTYITLDAKGDLFALATAGFLIARKGYERVADEPLRKLSEKLASDRFAQLQAENAKKFAGPVRIRNVRVFDPRAKALSALSDVVVSGSRISGVVPAGSPATPGETAIEGEGGTLVPGLFEMHGHMGQEDALMNVLAGITTVRDMGNRNDVLDILVDRIGKGEVAGPRIVRSGFIEGKSPFSSATGKLVASEAEAIEAVRWYAARGYNQAKLYNSMDPKWAPAVVGEAKRLGLRVSGHVPAFSSADEMIAAGFDEITHVNQLMLGWVLNPGEDTRTLFRFTAQARFPALDLKSDKVTKTLDAMAAKNVSHEPTIAIHELGLTALDGVPNPGAVDYITHMPPAEQRQLKQALFGADTPKQRADYIAAFAKIKETLAEMHRRGIMLIPGTDLGGGFTYHRELELFGQLGMTPADVLTRATLDMARYLGQDQALGSIERGKLADFFLVPGDPTKDLKAIKTIRMVARGGTVYFPDEVYTKLGIKPFSTPPKVEAAK